MSSTNVLDLSYVKETEEGVTPSNPTFQRLPITGCNLKDNISTKESEAIRKDRMTDDLIVVDAEVNGPIPYELSYTAYKPFMQSLVQASAASATVAVVDATDLSINATTKALESTTTDLAAAGIIVGMKLRITGFTEAGNNGIFPVTAVTANSVTLGAEDGVLVTEAAGDAVDLDGLCYRNGIAAPDTYTFKKDISVPGKTPSMFYYRGCQISMMSFNFETGEILKGEMGVNGMSAEARTSALTGESIDDTAAYTIMNSVSSITNIDITGLPETAFFKKLDLTIDNNANLKKGIGQLGARGIANFKLKVTGSIEMYFEDLSLYNIYKAATPFSLSFTLEDGDGNQIVFTLPKVKFEELDEPIGGGDEFLMEEGSIKALRDTVTNCMVQFDFFPALP